MENQALIIKIASLVSEASCISYTQKVAQNKLEELLENVNR